MPHRNVRLLCLCAGDPDGDRTFSGSARGLFGALEQLGCIQAKANVLGLTDSFQRGTLPVRLLRKLDVFGLEDRYNWSALSWARNTRRAERAARRALDFNAVLMYGTTFHPRLPQPTYVYLDATTAQVARARMWEFERFPAAVSQRVVSYQQDIFDHCAGVFPRSAWAAQSLLEDYRLPASRVVVAGAGSNMTAAPLPHGAYDTARILFIGSEWERKGGPLLVQAFRRLKRDMPHATLAVVGCTPEVNEPGVEVIGRLERTRPEGMQRLLEEYARASVFCIMSTFEPFGIVIVEAQQCGVACVAPAAFAFPETIRDGETGRLVNERTPEALASVLAEMLGDPARLGQMGQAAQRWANEEWTWNHTARRICERISADLDRREQ